MTFFDDKAYTINDLIGAVIAIETELGSLPAGDYASVRTRLDILEARINNPFAPAPNVENPFYIGLSGVSIRDGYGDPNVGGISAIPGSLYLREDGYVTQGLYVYRNLNPGPGGAWYQVELSTDDIAGGDNVQQTTITYPIYIVDGYAPDYMIFTDSSSFPIDVVLPVPTPGRVLFIKDKTGQAATYNVTVSPHGSEKIDGASTYVLNLAHAVVQLVSDGTNWAVASSYNGTVI
jgi:hypothetical protein